MKPINLMVRSIGYRLLFAWVSLLHKIYYRRIIIEGIENIPEGKVIFSPNHQNAIMDALAVLCAVKKPIFFMARGDFFKNRWIAAFFRFLRIYPAYRRVEGFHNLTHNYATMSKARKWLLSGGSVCIFPEGGHEGIWQLRPLSKGLFRLALETQASVPREPVYVVPVFIHYSSYTRWGTTLYLKFGKPINVLSTYGLWKMNKARGISELKNTVEIAMKQIVPHVENNYYTFIVRFAPFALEKFHVNYQSVLKQYVNHCNNLAKVQPEVMQLAEKKFDEFDRQIQKLGISARCLWNDFSLNRFLFHFTIRLVLSPFFLLGTLYLSPFFLLSHVINSRIDDRQFHSSVRFVLLSLQPLWHGFVFLITLLVFRNFAIALLTTLFFVSYTLLGFHLTDFFRQGFCEWKQFWYKKQLRDLKSQFEEILHTINFTYPYVAENKIRENIVSRY
ncbi:MAG: 1-acyl-sn-glycerol-3-phosphate acyltransferase [Bacteroidales bacterium]|nr:1-acyl-sn-glycerol-3-phosphate acyltransferase [Bacteroidales bacterium]